MARAPLWRQAFDSVERLVSEHAEAAVRTDAFADAVAVAGKIAAPSARLPARPPVGLAAGAGAVRWLGGQVDVALHRTRNGVRFLAGFDPPAIAQSPRELVWERDPAKLYRYASAQRRQPTPILLAMSLVSTPKVFDLRPRNSFVGWLLQAGFDVFLLDWGLADERDAGNGLHMYVDSYLADAVDAVCAVSAVEAIDLVGYCFGGVLAVLYTASNQPRIRRLAVMATPIDWSRLGPMVAMTKHGRLNPDDLFDSTGNVPAATIRRSFELLKPTARVAGWATLLERLDDDAFVEFFRAVTVWTEEHVPFPGACFSDMINLLARANALATGEVTVDERAVRLRDINCPVLCVVTERDHIVPPDSAVQLVGLVGTNEVQLLRVPAGHIGLLVGGSATKVTLPALAEFLTGRSTATRLQGASH